MRTMPVPAALSKWSYWNVDIVHMRWQHSAVYHMAMCYVTSQFRSRTISRPECGHLGRRRTVSKRCRWMRELWGCMLEKTQERCWHSGSESMRSVHCTKDSDVHATPSLSKLVGFFPDTDGHAVALYPRFWNFIELASMSNLKFVKVILMPHPLIDVI